MIRSIFVLMTAGLLVACGGGEDEHAAEAAEAAAPAAPAVEEPAGPTGPAPAEGYDWALHDPVSASPDQASLMYSVPETDDVPLFLTCQRGSGRVEAQTDSTVMGVGAIILRSGEVAGMYRVATRTPSDLSGGEFLTVPIALNDPTLQAFKENGWINLGVAGQARDLAAHPGAAREAITRFFSFCAPAPAEAASSD
ncbi:hypothetical protein [Brevundimonas aveniformis]|uniref:hypothetical protein n=1 Tax=Brevundimonas aveniformis TaxID=370977 RepID=UPI002490AEC8|nr:hypothetical protein [Brevundimonas aveniformis]